MLMTCCHCIATPVTRENNHMHANLQSRRHETGLFFWLKTALKGEKNAQITVTKQNHRGANIIREGNIDLLMIP
jgi:hypothetical protein